MNRTRLKSFTKGKKIGVGQAGNNIISDFENRGYNTFAINTSEIDLKAVDVETKFKVPGASGSNNIYGKR